MLHLGRPMIVNYPLIRSRRYVPRKQPLTLGVVMIRTPPGGDRQ